jgi:hypothetical protein
MGAGDIDIYNSGSSLLIDKQGTVEQIYIPKAGTSISNNEGQVFIQTADNKKYTFPYGLITTPTSTDIDDLVDQLEGYLDSNPITDRLDLIDQDYSLRNGNSYRASLSRNSVAAPENMALFRNTGVGYLRIKSIDFFFNVTTSISWEIYLNPTVTANGTIQTTINNKTDAPVGAAGELYDSPTISANGTLIRPFITDTNRRYYSDQVVLLLAPGNSLLFRRLSGGAGNEFRSTIIWDEVTL